MNEHRDIITENELVERVLFPESYSYTLPMKYINKEEYDDIFDEDGNQKNIIIGSGVYKGYKWVILSYYTHPAAYIVLNENDKYYEVPWTRIGLNVHGGVKYSQWGLHDLISKDEWVIGWHYGHPPSAFKDYSIFTGEGNKMSSIDVYMDILKAIDEITGARTWR